MVSLPFEDASTFFAGGSDASARAANICSWGQATADFWVMEDPHAPFAVEAKTQNAVIAEYAQSFHVLSLLVRLDGSPAVRSTVWPKRRNRKRKSKRKSMKMMGFRLY